MASDDDLEIPAVLPSPFATPPHPIALRAARELIAELPPADRMVEGKMFGVLVVRGARGLEVLRGFSGMLDGTHHVPGFVGPVFDTTLRDAFWPAGEAELAVIDRAIGDAALAAEPALATREALAAVHAAEMADLRAQLAANKRDRDAIRAHLVPGAGSTSDSRSGTGTDSDSRSDALAGSNPDTSGIAAMLAARSRADGATKRDLERAHAAAMAPIAEAARAATAEIERLVAHKRDRSRDFLTRIHATYRFANARGEVRSLAELFAPHAPPGGAGDCAAPKLFAHAYRHGLAPIALAELWWGPPPITGDRRSGQFYPACRGKCGPILAHVLGGLAVEPLPTFATTAPRGEPRIVHEEATFAVVDKPIGLLSVPGRTGAHRDSLATRLRARWPDCHLVHRLDLDTSGLVLVAKDLATYKELQKLFAMRAIAKRYIARLAHPIAAGAEGVIELPLRVDPDDRPRQVVDFEHGKPAITRYVALGGDRVALFPVTGRTHQLRVHAAHPRGLANPIRGDRLYGDAADRLYLHAETLEFAGRTFESPAPF